MGGDLAAFLAERYDEAGGSAQKLLRTAQDVRLALQDPRLLGRIIPGWHSWPDVEAMCTSRLADIALKRAILAGHTPVRSSGRTMCRTCLGSCTFWPCATVRQLGTEFADHAAYLREWAP